MKTRIVLKSLNDLAADIVEPEPNSPAQANPEPSPADAKTQRKSHVQVRAREYFDFAGYEHWGINE